ncbi:MAG: putative addiction module antidote protein [Desulfobacterales bacterium]|nr:putative addiction module antidote protein [Desulfobacterales bacterium]
MGIINQHREWRDYVIEDLKNNPDEIEEYLNAAFESFEQDKDYKAFLLALRTIAEAQGGITTLAKKTNLTRQSLYRALSPKGNPKLETVWSLMNALGYTLTFKPLSHHA